MDLGQAFEILLNGNVLAAAGAAFGMGIAGIGAAKGLGMSGSAASSLTAEQEKNFSSILILEALPQTQAIYAFVIGVTIIYGMMGGAMTTEKGMLSLFAGICVGLTGLSAIFQGGAAAAAVAAYGRNNNIFSKALIFVVMCELSALLGFIVSIMTLKAGNIF